MSGSAQDAWERLSHGKTLGKKANIKVDASDIDRPRGNNFNILQIGDENKNALQLCITLNPPTFIPNYQFPGSVVPDQGAVQDANGDRDNYSFLIPGSSIIEQSWSQPCAIVEWGIGGVQSKVECDFSNGLVLNICASWVRVSIFLDIIHNNVPVSGVMVLGAFVGPGFPKANNAQRTFLVGQINSVSIVAPGTLARYPVKPYNGPTVDATFPNMYPIPYYAKQATVDAVVNNTGSDSTFDVNLIFSRDQQASWLLGAARFTRDIRTPAIVPNGAMYFTVRNNIDSINLSNVIFDLAV